MANNNVPIKAALSNQNIKIHAIPNFHEINPYNLKH